MFVQYFAELAKGGRFDMDPRLPAEPTEDMDADALEALHGRMKDAIKGLVDSRPDDTFVRWYLADEDGKVVAQSDQLS